MFDSMSVIWLLLIILSVLILGLAYIVVALKRNQQHIAERLERVEQVIQVIPDHFEKSKRATASLANRLQSIEQKYRAIEMQLDKLTFERTDDKNYTDAIMRVKKGAGVEELVEHCHLMSNEAQLIVMMHANK
jgi:CII-binding regulator of phage lambda lysogenization HflD